MARPVVPFALLLQIAFPGGQRLPKRVAGKEPVPEGTQRFQSYPPNRANPVLANPHARETQPLGNLPNDEYRFWVGAPDSTRTLAICRYCGFNTDTIEQRRQHHLAADCKTHSLAVARYLNKAKICAVCGSPCSGDSWGFPLCYRCTTSFKFVIPRSGSPFDTYREQFKRDMREARRAQAE